MKQTLDRWDFRRGFEDAGRADDFSRQALETMFEYYEQLEEDCGIEIEFDAIAFCCEWSEYTLTEMYTDYSHVYRYEDWLEDMGDIYTRRK